MPSELPPAQPIEWLNWEHKNLLGRLDEILEALQGTSDLNWSLLRKRVESAVDLMEMVQESEERFLFPLISGVGDALLEEMRKEHGALLRASDSLMVSVRAEEPAELIRGLTTFREEASAHSAREKTEILGKATEILSSAQMDILRIKFATRSVI